MTVREDRAFLRTITTASGRDLLTVTEAFDTPDDLVFTVAIHAEMAIWNPSVTDLALIGSFISWVSTTVFGEFGAQCERGTLKLFWDTVCRASDGQEAKAVWIAAALRERLGAGTFPGEDESLLLGIAQLQAPSESV